MQHPYAGKKVSLLTKHGKQELLSPILKNELGCELVHTDDFDTDKLGTFTRDVDRYGSQLDAARRKATIGAQLTGLKLGIASEGSFGKDPYAGFMEWNTEILVWIDQELEIEVIGIANGSAQSMGQQVNSLDELMTFAKQAKFPDHWLILRPNHPDDPEIYKNINAPEKLVKAFAFAMEKSINGRVYVENDLRAFANPTRQKVIKDCAIDLIQKIKSLCPKCQTPGYWRTKRIPGQVCSFCYKKTKLPVAEIWSCNSCQYENQLAHYVGNFADPSKCDFCNP